MAFRFKGKKQRVTYDKRQKDSRVKRHEVYQLVPVARIPRLPIGIFGRFSKVSKASSKNLGKYVSEHDTISNLQSHCDICINGHIHSGSYIHLGIPSFDQCILQ